MADTQVSAFTALTGVNLAPGDKFPVIDVSATGAAKNKTMTLTELVAGLASNGLGIVTPKVLYVTKSGNDSTGDGTLAKPYITVQKAYDVAMAAYLLDLTPRCIDVGAGAFAAVTTGLAGWIVEISLKGCGHEITTIAGITSTGASGSASSGDAGVAGAAIHIRGTGINVGDIVANGGDGGSGMPAAGLGINGGNGGNGGDGGNVTLEDVAFKSISTIGGVGGYGGAGGDSDDGTTPIVAGNGGHGGSGGAGGTILLRRCVQVDVGGSILFDKGVGGTPGVAGFNYGGGAGSNGSLGGDGSDGTADALNCELLFPATSAACTWVRCLVKDAGSATMTDSTVYADLLP